MKRKRSKFFDVKLCDAYLKKQWINSKKFALVHVNLFSIFNIRFIVRNERIVNWKKYFFEIRR